jgi:hypothetical protein
MPDEKAKVIELRSRDPLTGQLQDDLLAVIWGDKYANLPNANVVGVLEFLKWNLINRSD